MKTTKNIIISNNMNGIISIFKTFDLTLTNCYQYRLNKVHILI